MIQNATSMLLQVILIVTFISIFFFTYISYIEKQIIVEQINSFVVSIGGEWGMLLSDSQKEKIKNSINNSSNVDVKDADERVATHNESLFNSTLLLLLSVFIIGISVVVALVRYYDLEWTIILRNSLIPLIVVFITEFIFITYIAANYKTLDPNHAKKVLFQILDDYSKSGNYTDLTTILPDIPTDIPNPFNPTPTGTVPVEPTPVEPTPVEPTPTGTTPI
jgi:hypothetical protein